MDITITHRSKVADARHLEASYRHIRQVEAMCSQCPNYGRVWSCPPFVSPYDLSPFTTAAVVATTITFDATDVSAIYPEEQQKAIMTEAIDAAWQHLLPYLYEQEALHPGSRVFTGRCRLCRSMPCTRPDGQPCRHADRLRHSLEAIGFDVEALTRDLLDIRLEWGHGGHLPPYLTLVTALFSTAPIPALPLPPTQVVILTR